MIPLVTYTCPVDRAPLSLLNGQFLCSQCKATFVVDSGVPLFTEERYWGEVSKAELQRLESILDNTGYEAFRQDLYLTDRSFFDFVFERTRADWHLCVPIQKNWRILEIGAGMGNSAVVLSELAAEVHAVDKSLDRVRFIKKRCEHEKRDNIFVAVGDALALPFPDNSFDLVSGNGLFEWIGVNDRFASPYEAQQFFLAEVKRVLKPGGYVYIGIENRLGASYFFGGIDHSGYKFTSLVPRIVADVFMKWKVGRTYQMYTYTKAGYDKHLKRAGFKNAQYFLPLPGYNLPKYIVAYDDLSALVWTARTLTGSPTLQRKVLRILLRVPGVAWLWRHFFFSFLIVAQKV